MTASLVAVAVGKAEMRNRTEQRLLHFEPRKVMLTSSLLKFFLTESGSSDQCPTVQIQVNSRGSLNYYNVGTLYSIFFNMIFQK